MKTQDYQCSINASVPVRDAYDKIARVSEWWAKDFKGSASKPGDMFTVRWGETFVDFRISEADPGRRIVWQVVNCHLPFLKNKTEWNGTSVAWHLSSDQGTTTVSCTHHGLTPEIECYNACEQGWNKYVKTSLLQFLNEGKGTPN